MTEDALRSTGRPLSALVAGAGRGAGAGAVFALLEVVLASTTGSAPASDTFVTLAVDVLAGAAAGAGLALALRPGQWAFDASLLFLPLAATALRGGLGWPGSLTGAGLGVLRFGVLLVPALLALHWRHHDGARRPLLGWALLLQSAAAAGLGGWSVPRYVWLDLLTGAPVRVAAVGALLLGLTLLAFRWRVAAGFAAAGATLAVGILTGTRVPDPGSTKDAAQRPGGPNLIVITLDTVRADHVSAYGYARATTPQLDRFAQRATLFEHAYANSPYTLSTHASLFTGLLPSEHGAHPVPFSLTSRPDDYSLRPNVPTLAERLRSRGYATAAVAANGGYLGRWTGLDRGFEYYDCYRPRFLRLPPLFVPLLWRFDERVAARFSNEATRNAAQITDAALAWLREAPPGQPFFLFVNYYDPHHPYTPPAEFRRLHLPRPDLAPVTLSLIQGDLERGRRLTPQERAYLVGQYDGELSFMDRELGRLIRELGSRNLYDASAIVVTSDHGEFFGEHGLIQHERDLFEEVLRVPYVVKAPGQSHGHRDSERIGLDETPALVEALLQGGQLTDWLRSRDPDRLLVAEYWTTARLHRVNPLRYRAPAMRALLRGRYKLIERLSMPAQLFDLAADPREGHDLLKAAEPASAVASRMLEGLLPLSATTRRSLPEAERSPDEALRALGYIN